MGAIYILEGILIYMYGFDHNPPHIHAFYSGDEIIINIGDRFVKGQAPSKVIRKLNEFIDTHEEELLALWEKAQRGETIEKIQH